MPEIPPPADEQHPRLVRRRIGHLEDYLACLESARRVRARVAETAEVDALIASTRTELNNLLQIAGERLESRRRPKLLADKFLTARPEFYLFLDECGDHDLRGINPSFPVFCLCGVIVEKTYYHKVFEPSWRRLKALHLGSEHVTIHEPELRRRRGHFEFRGDDARARAFNSALARCESRLKCWLIASVIDKQAFRDRYGDGGADAFLPPSHYLSALDFVLERFLHFLHYQGRDAEGHVIAEARGAKDDAEVQFEYVRLQLEGTRYHAGTWFRHQLASAIQFQTKHDRSCGLELADLLARPVAEKVMYSDREPERWDLVDLKLYDGGQGEKHKYGLKVFPATIDGAPEDEPKPAH